MLILTRRPKERIMVADTHIIQVRRIYRGYIVVTVNGKPFTAQKFANHTAGPATFVYLGVNHQGAKIGIDAPKNIPVHREEIWQRIQDENQKELLI